MEFIKSFVNINEIFPNFIKYLNFYRNIKGRFHLMRFLYKWDPDYRKDLIVTFLAFGLFGYSAATWNNFYDIVAMVIEVAIIMVQLGGELSILPTDYRPSNGGVIYSITNSTHVLNGELSFSMSDIKPNPVEEALGFCNPVEDIKICKDSPLVSNKVDDALMLRKNIPYYEEKSETNFISSRHQLRYIAIRVANKKQHTTNGELLAFYDLANSLIHKNSVVTMRKAWYFDALLTIEAFRGRIFRGNLNSEKEIYTDLTTYFPVEKYIKDGKDFIRFKSDFYKRVSAHTGITTLIITEKKQVAMLYQGNNKVIGSKTVCLGGSGSMDYADIESSGKPEDLRDLLSYSMAREVCEETGMKEYFNEIKNNTIITGFFRWVDRSGKPEFIGLTRAGNVKFSSHNSIDYDEVVKFEEIPIEVNKPEDFLKVMDYIQENKINVPLSSFMSLYRMTIVANYNKEDSTAEQKQIYKIIADFLEGK